MNAPEEKLEWYVNIAILDQLESAGEALQISQEEEFGILELFFDEHFGPDILARERK